MADKKSILIVSYLFAPQNAIGAVRPTKLAKYLTRMGHEVTVVCGEGMSELQDPTLARDLEELRDVRVVREWNPLRERNKRKQAGVAAASATGGSNAPMQGVRSGMKQSVLNAVYLWLRLLSDRSFARMGFREIRRMNRKFDVVLSTYGPKSVHDIAARVKAEGIAGQWLADFRDVAQMPFGWQKGAVRRVLEKTRRDADWVTAVSAGVLEAMDMLDIGRVLNNGFDREDLVKVPTPTLPSKRLLRFVYCGQLYAGKRDLTPFFTALTELLKQGLCELDEIQVVYAGAEGDVLKEQARGEGLEGLVLDIGRVSREESLGLQKEADVLLLASWNAKGETGILTGKMLEYFMIGKPIVCCMNGDLPGSETKSLLEGKNIGICFEQANAADDEIRLRVYLAALLARVRKGETALGEEVRGGLDAYSYPAIAKEVSRWMEEEKE